MVTLSATRGAERDAISVVGVVVVAVTVVVHIAKIGRRRGIRGAQPPVSSATPSTTNNTYRA